MTAETNRLFGHRPTRTSLLSGRYAYNIQMNGEVIVDGSPSCMPLSVSTIADRLQEAGWATAAYGYSSSPSETLSAVPSSSFHHLSGSGISV